MTHEEFLAAFHSQLETLHQIAIELGVLRDSPALPSDVLSFAEDLLLCPTHHAASGLMQRDKAKAQAFLDLAVFQSQHINEIRVASGHQSLAETTPFFAVASAVQEYLQFLKKSVPHEWK